MTEERKRNIRNAAFAVFGVIWMAFVRIGVFTGRTEPDSLEMAGFLFLGAICATIVLHKYAPMKFHFAIRDLIFITIIVALVVGWWFDRRSYKTAIHDRNRAWQQLESLGERYRSQQQNLGELHRQMLRNGPIDGIQ